MTSLELVDPQQRELVATFPPVDLERDDLGVFRANLVAGMTALLTPEPVSFEERWIPGPEGASEIRLVIHRPEKADSGAPAILYVHGGGMIAGTPDMMAGVNRAMALATGAIVIVPDYRLAPETPFPGGLEDVYASLAWVQAHATELGIDPKRISIMGDSGGGGLAAATALLARDRGDLDIRAQILVYPMLDMRTGGPDAVSDDPLTGEFIWTRAQNKCAWAMIRGSAPVDRAQLGYLSPALATDLTRLPPAFILTGALDLFRDEDIAYAQRLMRSGVAVDLEVWSGAVHGFDMLPGDIATRATADLMATIRRLI